MLSSVVLLYLKHSSRCDVPCQVTPSRVSSVIGTERQPHESATAVAPGATLAEPLTKTVGTQSVYRESEAQTDPFSPEYMIADGQVPEVLTLTHLAYGAGLPATEAELLIIERTRQKRLFTMMLPPATDQCSLDIRMALMEAQEFRDWADRERNIRELQEQRLVLLAEALQSRDERRELELSDKAREAQSVFLVSFRFPTGLEERIRTQEF